MSDTCGFTFKPIVSSYVSEARVAHQESISICGIVSTVDPARETALSASFIGSPNASSTEIASMAVRPSPPAQ